ncbi:MAG: hypothetical protein HKL82_01985 [Acidimicrobiaceae bacterium]|nr:hypothetical protein [Acidimicrobiaceae bacterium]
MVRGPFRSIISLVYLVVGAIVANSHSYFVQLANLKAILSAALAIILWPLLYFGVNLHIR